MSVQRAAGAAKPSYDIYDVDERNGDSVRKLDVSMHRGLMEFVQRSGVAELAGLACHCTLQIRPN